MTDKEQIWRRIAEMETPGFFITADIMCEGSSELDGLDVFIKGKMMESRRRAGGQSLGANRNADGESRICILAKRRG